MWYRKCSCAVSHAEFIFYFLQFIWFCVNLIDSETELVSRFTARKSEWFQVRWSCIHRICKRIKRKLTQNDIPPIFTNLFINFLTSPDLFEFRTFIKLPSSLENSRALRTSDALFETVLRTVKRYTRYYLMSTRVSGTESRQMSFSRSVSVSYIAGVKRRKRECDDANRKFFLSFSRRIPNYFQV